MQAAVELTVAGAGESVADNVAGGHIDRGGAGVGGERSGGAESVDRADPAEDLAGGQRADTEQLGQGGARMSVTAVGDVGGGFGDAAVQVAYLGDEVHGEAAQGLAGGIAGSDPAEEFGGLARRSRSRLCAGGDEVGEHDVEAVDGLGAGFDQVIAVFDDSAQGGDGALDGGGGERACAVSAAIPTLSGVGGVGFAAVPGRQHPHPGSELGGDIDDVDPVGA